MERIYLITLLINISIFSYSQTDFEIRDISFSDQHYDSIMIIIDTISDSSEYVKTIWYVWTNRDGAIGAEISPYVANAILKYPELIFQKFSENPISFKAFVERLPYDLFTDYRGDQTEDLINLKLKLLNKLDDFNKKINMREYSQQINELYERTSNSTIRKID